MRILVAGQVNFLKEILVMKILLTHTPHARLWYGEKAVEELSQLGDLVVRESDSGWKTEELVDAVSDIDIVVSDRSTAAPAELFEKSDRLLAFVRCAMDIRNIDVSIAAANGVLVTRAGPGFVPAVSEWIIGQLVNLARSIPHYITEYRSSILPEPLMGRQVAGMTVGVVGFGNIGKYIAPILDSLKAKVLVYDPWVEEAAGVAIAGDFNDLLKRSDVIICLAAYTDDTENLFNEEAFSTMKPGAFFINASRGSLVDEKALEHALDTKRIAGAALDVGRDHDNLPFLHLAKRSDIIATPHIAGMVPEAIEFQAFQTVNQVRDIIQGKMPEGAINPESARRLKKKFFDFY